MENSGKGFQPEDSELSWRCGFFLLVHFQESAMSLEISKQAEFTCTTHVNVHGMNPQRNSPTGKSAMHPRSRDHGDHGCHMRRNITSESVNSLLNPRIVDSRRDCSSEVAVSIIFQDDAAGPVFRFTRAWERNAPNTAMWCFSIGVMVISVLQVHGSYVIGCSCTMGPKGRALPGIGA